MKQVTGTSNGSEKWLLLVVVIVGIAGLFLTFNSTPDEQQLELEGLQLDGQAYAPGAEAEDHYALQ